MKYTYPFFKTIDGIEYIIDISRCMEYDEQLQSWVEPKHCWLMSIVKRLDNYKVEKLWRYSDNGEIKYIWCNPGEEASSDFEVEGEFDVTYLVDANIDKNRSIGFQWDNLKSPLTNFIRNIEPW